MTMSDERREHLHAHADHKVPPHIAKLTHYMHSLTEIWEYYRALGNNPPKPFMAEMARAESELLTALEDECQQGGALFEFYKNQETK